MVRYFRQAAFSAASLVLLLATDGTAARTVHLSLAAARRPAVAHRAAPPDAAPHRPARLGAVPYRVFTGAGFDACSAPPLEAMRAWRGASPYGVVGVYTSGAQRGCDQPLLTADWVRQVRSLGWRLLPTHVGRQAPCSDRSDKPQRIDPGQARQQGAAEAAEAVRGARAVGLGPGTPVYLDLEAYRSGDPTCTKAVIDFTVGWTQGLHGAGYWSGFYSSLDSGITDLVAADRAGAGPLPDAVWYARWDGRDSTDGAGSLGDDQWSSHQRAHQFSGSAQETWGGVALEVDRDQLDTVVAW